MKENSSSSLNETNTKKTTFYLAQYLFRLIILVSLELYKYTKGQKLSTVLNNSITFIIVFYSIQRFSSFIFIISTIISISEAVTWTTIQTPLTYQALSSFEVKFITDNHPEFLLAGIISFVILIFVSRISFKRCNIVLNYDLILFQMLSIPFIYIYIANLSYNFQNNALFRNGKSVLYDRIVKMIEEKPRVVKKRNNIKNIILYQIESFEVTAIDKDATPYLYNLTQQYLYLPMEIATYTSWSTSGTLITQCGIPQIIKDISWGSRSSDSIGPYSKMNCMSDYFKSLGFPLLYYATSYSDCQGFRQFMKGKNYSDNIVSRNDKGLMEYMTNKFIPEHSKRPKDPFFAWVVNEDTHLPYSPRKWCKPENPKASNFRKAHNCFDQITRGFVDAFLNSPLKDNTLLVLFPDHNLMATWMPKPRNVFMLFPGIEKREHRGNLNYYDFAHTVNDLAGIRSVYPGYLYGSSAFSRVKPKYPNNPELFEMYYSFNELFKIKSIETFVCNGKKQDRPCDNMLL